VSTIPPGPSSPPSLAHFGSASSHPSVIKYARHVNPAFVRLLGALGYGRVFVRARGTRIWDHEGKEYLDFLAGSGAVNLGHNPPKLIEKLRDALSADLVNLVHTGPQIQAGDLAADLAKRAGEPLSVCLFSSGGAEAVESAIKLARAATRRRGIVYCKHGFHGTSLGSLSIMGSGRMRDPFEPLLPECYEVPFGDLLALEKELVEKKIAAFVVEPIQVEAGVIMPPELYLKSAQALCTKHGALLVLDEVQTGIGRTGTMFAYQAEGFVPDVLVLGKALGGSLVPISAALVSADLHARAFGSMDKFDLHGSTFSGNALGCTVATATLAIVDEDGLVENARAQGERLKKGLEERLAGHPFVREIRGRGLLVALELGLKEDKGLLGRLMKGVVDTVSKRVFGQWLSLRLLEKGILCQPATNQWNVLKLEPPLTVSEAEIDEVISAIAQILEEYRDIKSLVFDVGERLGKQFKGGWGF
jgi:putrescine aminotransferase